MNKQDIEEVLASAEYAEALAKTFIVGTNEWAHQENRARKLRALADRMEKQEAIKPDCVWEPEDTFTNYQNEAEYVAECQMDWEVGETFKLSEAYYFEAEFRVTKLPDEEGDYEVERISGTDVFTHQPDATSKIAGLENDVLALKQSVSRLGESTDLHHDLWLTEVKTTNELKAQRDRYKADAERYRPLFGTLCLLTVAAENISGEHVTGMLELLGAIDVANAAIAKVKP